MNRKYYLIWFVIYTLLQWPLMSYFPLTHSILMMLITMLFFAIVLGNIIGLVPIIRALRHAYNDFSLYLSNPNEFHASYQSDYPYDISNTMILWKTDIFPLLISCVVLLHLYMSAKRCKNIGISTWWCLVPLYNPIVLMFRKSKADVSNGNAHNVTGTL